MIAVSTPALMATALEEPDAEACAEAVQTHDRLLIGAGTAARSLIVAAARKWLS